MEPFRRQRTGGGTKAQRRVGWDEEFVVDSARLLVGALKKMRDDLNAVTALLVVDLRLIRLERGDDEDLIVGTGFHGDGAILCVHGDIRVWAHYIAQFLLSLGAGNGDQTGGQDYHHHIAARNSLHKTPLGSGLCRPTLYLTECDPMPFGRAMLSVGTLPTNVALRPRLPGSA